MPQRLLPATVSHFPLEVLVGHWEKYLATPSFVRELFHGLRDSLWTCPLQPGRAGWSHGQNSHFISAVCSGADLGSHLTNDWYEPESAGRALAEYRETLIDGQQPLHNLEEYLLDRLAVPDAQVQPRIWSELGNGGRKRFLSTIFTHTRVQKLLEGIVRSGLTKKRNERAFLVDKVIKTSTGHTQLYRFCIRLGD